LKSLKQKSIYESSYGDKAGAKVIWPEARAMSKVLINADYYHLHFSNQAIVPAPRARCTARSP
jgi:hypothetical protein